MVSSQTTPHRVHIPVVSFLDLLVNAAYKKKNMKKVWWWVYRFND
jgi:hypothetical protein